MENGQTYVIWLSELRRSMGKLAILCKWAGIVLKIVFAHLGLELLLKCIELALVTVEIIVVRLLSEVLQDLTRWVVEVSWSTFGVQSLTLILRLWLALRVQWSGWAIRTFSRFTISWSLFLWGSWAILFYGWDVWVSTEVLNIVVEWVLTVLNNL